MLGNELGPAAGKASALLCVISLAPSWEILTCRIYCLGSDGHTPEVSRVSGEVVSLLACSEQACGEQLP